MKLTLFTTIRKLTFSSKNLKCMARSFSAVPQEQPSEPLTIHNSNSPKLLSIAESISSLSLIEVADLVQILKTRLNIKDIVMPVASMAAPVAAAQESSSEKDEQSPAEEAVKVQTEFKVTLVSIDANSKAKSIRVLKTFLPELSLVEAKGFVESLPKVIKANATDSDSEAMKKAFEELGGVITVE